MKKLILILFIFIWINSFSQTTAGLYVNDKLKPPAYTTYTMDGDTSYLIPTRRGYIVSAQLTYASLDAVDGSAKWQASNDSLNWLDYTNLDSISLDAATDSKAISIPQWHVDNFKYHRLFINSGASTSGTLEVYIRINSDK